MAVGLEVELRRAQLGSRQTMQAVLMCILVGSVSSTLAAFSSTNGDAGVLTSVGVLPLDVAEESESSTLSHLLLQKAATKSDAAAWAKQLEAAMLKDERSTLHNLFVAWSRTFGRRYDDITKAETTLATFTQSVWRLIRTNTALEDSGSSWMGLNQFSGTSVRALKAEGRKLKGHEQLLGHMKLIRSRKQAGDPRPTYPDTIPPAFSHKDAGNLSPVVDQGLTCGSCWATSATSALDAAVMIHMKQIGLSASTALKFSRQVTLDCATSVVLGDAYINDNGCNQGDAGDALRFMQGYTVPLETQYPYISGGNGLQGPCQRNLMSLPPGSPITFVQLANGPLYYQTLDEGYLMKATFKQPVVVYWSACDGWATYDGGIFTVAQQADPVSGCFQDCQSTDHALLLVGYSRPLNYWIVQNSWGTSWGEEGFFRTAMTHDANGPCGLHCYVVAPDVVFKTANLPAAVSTSPPVKVPPPAKATPTAVPPAATSPPSTNATNPTSGSIPPLKVPIKVPTAAPSPTFVKTPAPSPAGPKSASPPTKVVGGTKPSPKLSPFPKPNAAPSPKTGAVPLKLPSPRVSPSSGNKTAPSPTS